MGPVSEQFKLLGIRYNITRAHRALVEDKWKRNFQSRLRKISVAVR